ncbi:MAG: RNA-binding S4 domain-containing protein [Candidatus Omnitrophica bacterium]|nr:RNA-binding S4 domain-containing protein [Candidatus Omnitrophota bacterium]
MEFKLKSEFIELDNMLKVLELVSSGAEAKQQIQAGSVKVNGEVESRIRRKLRSGDCVEFAAQKINVIV